MRLPTGARGEDAILLTVHQFRAHSGKSVKPTRAKYRPLLGCDVIVSMVSFEVTRRDANSCAPANFGPSYSGSVCPALTRKAQDRHLRDQRGLLIDSDVAVS
jgi:hypothetical protein